MKIMYFGMQGLGDHISANGLIRHLLETYACSQIDVLVWSHYSNTIQFMYRDEPKINIINITSGNELRSLNTILKTNLYDIVYLIGPNNISKDTLNKIPTNTKIICISFDTLYNMYEDNNDCHQLYYKGAGVEFNVRFDKFYYTRDEKEEDLLYQKYNPNNLPYIFIHDDPYRGYNITTKWNDLIIRNNPNENIFNYYKLLQNAEEIHCMESSFRCFLETIDVKTTKLFLHHYVRNTKPFLDKDNKIVYGASKKSWKILI